MAKSHVISTLVSKHSELQLQIISQNYVVWNLMPFSLGWNITFSCKLYHKTTWFETLPQILIISRVVAVANYITKLRGLKPTKIFYNEQWLKSSCKLYHKTTWFETVSMPEKSSRLLRCKLYHKTTWFETSQNHQLSLKIL